MPAGDAGYLPPVVAKLLAESGDFVAKIAEAKSVLADFARSDTQTQIGANVLPLESTLTSVKMQLLNFTRDVYRARLGADSVPLLTEVAALRRSVEAMSPMDIRIGAEISGALAKIAELKGALAMLQLDSLLGEGVAVGGGRSGIGGMVAGLLGGLGLAGGAGGAPGLATLLGWKGLPALPLIGGLGMAGFATPLGLAGFSAEHVITTSMGLLGSAGGAAAGGGLLALGNMGISGVGMGSDSAVMRSTIADTRELSQTYQQLEQAQALYGKNSAQAAYYTKLLNFQMADLGNTAGVQAELGLVKASEALDNVWDQATSNARVQAVNIMTQVLGLAQTFIPAVAGAAARNLGIINTAIRPLFDWLQTTGLAIFGHLEDLFAQRLPMSVDAFTQGIEILIKTIAYVSDATGGFLPKLDRWLQYMNSSQGFIRWEHDIDVLIGMFHTWAKFIVDLGKVLVDTFKLSAGLGVGIIQTLDDMLVKLDAWINSAQGKAELKTLFQVHKDEVIALLKILPALAPLAQVYLQLAPAMTQIAVAIAQFVGWLIRLPKVGPILEYALAFYIIAQRLGILRGLGVVFRILTSDAVVAAARTLAAWTVAAARTLAAWLLTGVRIVAGWIAQAALAVARVALIVAANVAGALATAAAWAAAWIVAFWPIALLVVLVAIAVALIVTHWQFFKTWFTDMWNMTVILVKEVWAHIVLAAEQAFNWIRDHWGQILFILTGPFGLAVGEIVAHFNGILSAGRALISGFRDIGVQIVQGMISGITSMAGRLAGAAQGLINGLSSDVKKFLGITSPSRLFAEQIGVPIAQGIAVGITQGQGHAMSALVGLNQALVATAHGLARPSLGGPAFAGAGGGLNATISMPITVQVTGAAAGSPQAIGTAVAQEVNRHMNQILKSLKSGAYAVPGQ